MPNRKPQTPSYRHHKASGQAVVTLSGRDLYLGKYGTEASRGEYDRLVSEWLTRGRRLPSAPDGAPDLTVTEVLAAHWKHATDYYVKDGQLTSELSCLQ